MPERIQRRRTKGWRMPSGAIYVGRPSRWGNPFVPTQSYMVFSTWGFPMPLVHLPNRRSMAATPDLGWCIEMYVAWLRGRLDADPTFIDPLIGRDLVCWCALDAPCHADVLLRLAKYAAPR